MKEGIHGYRDARRCADCANAEVRLFGSGSRGYYCMRHESRVNKNKVCDLFRLVDWEEMETPNQNREYYGG